MVQIVSYIMADFKLKTDVLTAIKAEKPHHYEMARLFLLLFEVQKLS